MKSDLDRLGLSEMSSQEIEQLLQVLGDAPSLVGRKGSTLRLPSSLSKALLSIAKAMKKGETVVLMPQDEVLSTKAASDLLGVSRPYLVKLLDEGAIPSTKTGSHRRVRLQDLQTYMKARDADRHGALRRVFDAIQEADHYEDVA